MSEESSEFDADFERAIRRKKEEMRERYGDDD